MTTSLGDAAGAADAPARVPHPTEPTRPTTSGRTRWRPGAWTGPLAWTWLGLLVGVSLLATPVKFTVDSLPRPTALEVGRATFAALTAVEWGFAAVLLVMLVVAWRSGAPPPPPVLVAAGVVGLAVVVQATWLLPALDDRVTAIVAGADPPPSVLHTVYGGVEGIQALALAALGVTSARVRVAASNRF
ncbi:MAG: DUF4149 domain-containing protein [Acidimicrobiales bacterium]